RGLHRSRDGIGNIVELEIEPDLRAGGQNRAHNLRTLGRVKLEADFEKRDFAAELLDEFERLSFRGDVQRHDDLISSVCHTRQLFVTSNEVETPQYRSTVRDSSTSLGMTEQIAGYASSRTRED